MYFSEKVVPKNVIKYRPRSLHYSWHGTSCSSMAQCLNFSEADSVSVSESRSSRFEGLSSKGDSNPYNKSGASSQLTKDQQLFEEQFMIGHTEMEAKK